jgi:fructose-1,6-bisphosphatase/inositol monophosphatase family enzyme
MKLTNDHLAELSQIAINAAKAAGQLIAHCSQEQKGAISVSYKSGVDNLAAQVITEVDLKCETLILSYLESTLDRFELALLSEESEDNRQRLSKDYFWCIDPLDGTLAFSRSQPGYSVSIALVSQEGIPQIGVVYDPASQTLYSAIRGGGAMRNGKAWKIGDSSNDNDAGLNKTNPLTVPCDHSFVARDDFEKIFERFETKARMLGYNDLVIEEGAGAVINAIKVIEQAPACYFKLPKPQPGGGSLWDFAATACIFNELGAFVSDANNQTLDLNRKDSTFMNHRGVIYASNESLRDAALGILKDDKKH